MGNLLDLDSRMVVPEAPQFSPPAELPEPDLTPDEDRPPQINNLLDLPPPVPPPLALQPALDIAVPGNAEEAARNKRLSEQSGMSIEGVEIDPDAVEQEVNKRRIDSLLDLAPVTKRFTSDVRNAQITHDVTEELVKSEAAAEELGFWGQVIGPGIDKLQALGFRAADFIGEVTGNEALEAFGQEGAIREFENVARAGGHIQIADVETQEDLVKWLKSLGSDVPTLAPGLLASMAVVGLGAAVGAAAVPVIIGSIVAAFIPSFVLGLGEVQQGVKERGGEEAKAPLAVFAAGTLIALLDSVLPGKVGSMLAKEFTREGAEQIIKMSVAKIAQRTASAGGKGFALEGVTEAFQEAIGEVGAAIGTDTDVDTGELAEQMVESFARGAMLGGGTTATANVVVEANRARKTKAAMDKLNKLKTEGKLQTRSPGLDADITEAQLQAAGVNEVLVPVDVVLQFANNHQTMIPGEALAQLGDIENLETAIRASILGGDTNVRIPARAFSEAVLGTDGYALMAPFLKLHEGQKSFAESAQDVQEFVSDEEVDKLLADELEQYDASRELKARVEETLGKIKTDPMTALDTAEDNIKTILADLLGKVEERTKPAADIEIAGRRAQLESDIAQADQTVAQLDTDLEAREEANRSRTGRRLGTKQAENRLDKAIAQREKLEADLLELNVPAQRAPIDAATQEQLDDQASKDRRPKPSKVRTAVLQDLQVQTQAQAARAAVEAFKKGLSASKEIVKAKEAVVEAIDGLDVLDLKVQQRLIKRINHAETIPQLRRVTAAVQSRVAVLMANQRRVEIRSAVAAVIKKYHPTITGGKPKGDDAEASAVFIQAKSLMAMRVKDAQAALEVEMENNEPLASGLFRRQLLALRAGSPNLSPTAAENLLLDLNALGEGARGAALERATGRAKQRDEWVAFGIEALGDVDNTRGNWVQKLTKKLPESVSTYLSVTRDGWSDMLDVVFNGADVDPAQAKKFIDALSMTAQIQNFHARTLKWHDQFVNLAYEAFGIEPGKINELEEKFTEDSTPISFGEAVVSVENPKTGEVTTRTEKIEYSRAEIRKLWMEYNDPTLRSTIQDPLGMGFKPELLNRLFYTLTDQDIAFAEAQLAFYKKLYPQVNKVYRKSYGVDLPFNEFYSPIQREGVNLDRTTKMGLDMALTDERKFRRSIPGALKSRVHNIEKLKRRNDVGVMQQYMHDMAWFIETHERVRDIKSVFSDPALTSQIENGHGSGMNNFIQGFLEDFGTGYAARGVHAEKMFGYFNRAFTSAQLSIPNWKIGAKQLGSYLAMMEDVPTVAFIQYEADFLKSRTAAKKIVKFLWENSPALRARGSSLEFELARIGNLEDKFFRWKGASRWQRTMFSVVRMGDRFPIYAGGWAVYQNAIRQGKSHTKAIEAFEKAFNDTQQSNDLDRLNQVQRMGDFGRTLTLFMTARLSLLRAQARAWRQRPKRLGGTGKIDYRTFGKRMAIYHFAIPMFIQFIASGYRIDKDRQLIAAALGQLNSVVIFGRMLEWAMIESLKGVGAIDEDTKNFEPENLIPATEVMAQMLQGVSDAFESIEQEEYWEAFKDLAAEIAVGFGKPGPSTKNFVNGVERVLDGDTELGLRMMFSESEFSAEESVQRDFIE